jgi:RNA 2',3'-cyclic 3'-phosphodiesterase
MIRLFAGLQIPDGVREDLRRLRQPVPGARWIEPENFHVTLRFYGDVDNATAREIDDYLARVQQDSFEIRLLGLGTFGGNEPRTVWAGVETNPLLEMLANTCERAARVAGLPPERRKFRPHITLARLKNPRAEPIARLLERRGGFKTEPFPVTQFFLFSSKPRTGGGPYVPEQAYDLRDHGWTEQDETSYAGNHEDRDGGEQ